AGDSRAAGQHPKGNQVQPWGVELVSDAAAKGAPQLRRVEPHREATRDSRTAHPRMGRPACGGQEARSEVGTPGSLGPRSPQSLLEPVRGVRLVVERLDLAVAGAAVQRE